MKNKSLSDAEIAQVRHDDLLQATLQATGGMLRAGTVMPLPVALQSGHYVQLSAEYEANGIFSAIIDRVAEDAMAAGFEWHEAANPETIAAFEAWNLDDILTDGLRFARLHGACLLVPSMPGTGKLSSPLYYSRMKEIAFWDVISIDRLTVASRDAQGYPLTYHVKTKNQDNGGQYELHRSRTIPILGRRRTYHSIDTQLIFPGVSEGQRVRESALRLSRSFDWAERALERKSQGVFKMKGLGQTLQALKDGQALVAKRLELVDTVRSLLNTIAVDGDDDYAVQDTNLSSISDSLDSQMQAVAAVSGVPITVLFGRRTTSLNSKGDSDTDTYYRLLDKTRTTYLRTPMREILRFASATLDVSVPQGELLVKVRPLKALSDYEESEIELRQAQAFYARAQAIKLLVTQKEPGQQTGTDENGKPITSQPTEKMPDLLTPEEAKAILMNEDDNK